VWYRVVGELLVWDCGEVGMAGMDWVQVCQGWMGRWVQRLRGLAIVGLLGLLLTGCVDYRVGVRFASPNGGVLTQQVHLDGLGAGSGRAWLAQVDLRARSLQGRVERLSEQDLRVEIPFTNGADLEKKFNRFFAAGKGLPEIASHLAVRQSNLLLFEWDRLIYDVDLTSLGVQSGEGEMLLSPEQLFKLKFGVNGREWTLKPGQKNHLEASVWMLMPLGFGAAAIVGLVAIGLAVQAGTLKLGSVQPLKR
jgi:Protein of unknown function (DUF3153)